MRLVLKNKLNIWHFILSNAWIKSCRSIKFWAKTFLMSNFWSVFSTISCAQNDLMQQKISISGANSGLVSARLLSSHFFSSGKGSFWFLAKIRSYQHCFLRSKTYFGIGLERRRQRQRRRRRCRALSQFNHGTNFVQMLRPLTNETKDHSSFGG